MSTTTRAELASFCWQQIMLLSD